MKILELTQKQKEKLLEMCTILFTDILDRRECYCDEDQGAGYTYSDEYGDCDVCKDSLFEFWDNCLHFNTEKYRVSIHWFEFCMTHLSKKILKNNYFKIGAFSNIVLFQNNHPIDYLHGEFKKLKL